MRLLAIAAVLAIASVARADEEDFHGAQVVYAKGTSLWKTDARGKKSTELVALPDGAKAETVRAIRADATGKILVVDLGGTWYWTKLSDTGDTAAPLAAIGCGAGAAATLALDGTCVVCANDKGSASVRKLGTDAHVDRDVPATGAIVAGAQAARALIWADPTGVWSAPVGGAHAQEKKPLAGEAPLAHFSPSPDGARALGVYKAADEKDAQLLYSFPLDGSGARRKVIRNAVPIEWSWDSAWVLVQDGGSACVMRAVGGEYKCWKGYTAVGIAEDGAWALLLGPRDGSAAKSKPKAKPKHDQPDDNAESEDETDAVDTAVPLPKRPFSLFRARRDGAYTEKPVAIVRDVDGPAAWLPGAP